MGEIADYYVDKMIDGGFRLPPYKKVKPKPKPKNFQSGVGYARWRTASGEVVNMCDMEIRHLQNCLRLCDDYGNTGKAREIREHLLFRAGLEPSSDPPFDLGAW